METSETRSKLFHAIVVVGAALGSACGGSTTTTAAPDASADATRAGEAGPMLDALAEATAAAWLRPA